MSLADLALNDRLAGLGGEVEEAERVADRHAALADLARDCLV